MTLQADGTKTAKVKPTAPWQITTTRAGSGRSANSRGSAEKMTENRSHIETDTPIYSARKHSRKTNDNKFILECRSRTQRCLTTQNNHSSCLLSDWVSKHVGVICFEWYVSAWLWVLFFFFGALLGFGYEYLESYTDNYPRSFGAFSFQTPWSLWEAAATLSWISATSKPANLYLFIAASEHISPPPIAPNHRFL